jgi:hypothetical protein
MFIVSASTVRFGSISADMLKPYDFKVLTRVIEEALGRSSET